MFLTTRNGLRQLSYAIRRHLSRQESYSYANPIHLMSVMHKLEQVPNAAQLSESAIPGSSVSFELRYNSRICEVAKVRLVQPNQADKHNDVSILSPLGALLLGSQAGEEYIYPGINAGFYIKVLKVSA